MVGVALERRAVFVTRADFWRSSSCDDTFGFALVFYCESGLNKRNHGSNGINNNRCHKENNAIFGNESNTLANGTMTVLGSRYTMKMSTSEILPQPPQPPQLQQQPPTPTPQPRAVTADDILGQCMETLFGDSAEDTTLKICEEEEKGGDDDNEEETSFNLVSKSSQ